MDKAKDPAPFVAHGVPIGEDDAPLPALPSPASLSPDALRRFLGEPEAQQRIRSIVIARAPLKTPTDVVDEIVQRANVAALGSSARPRSTATASGWLATVAARAVADFFRHAAIDRRWIAPDADADALPGETAAPPTDEWLIATWLAPILAAHPRDQETYELIVYKAHTGETYAHVAAAHGMTSAALSNRIHAFKTTYAPRWRARRSRAVILVLLFGVAVAALVAGLVRARTSRDRATHPAPSAPLPVVPPAPSATTSSAPFAPAQSAAPSPPTNQKP